MFGLAPVDAESAMRIYLAPMALSNLKIPLGCFYEEFDKSPRMRNESFSRLASGKWDQHATGAIS